MLEPGGLSESGSVQVCQIQNSNIDNFVAPRRSGNPKQTPMAEIRNSKRLPSSCDSVFVIGALCFEFVSDFEFRASDLDSGGPFPPIR
jgi:hypothetical protein